MQSLEILKFNMNQVAYYMDAAGHQFDKIENKLVPKINQFYNVHN